MKKRTQYAKGLGMVEIIILLLVIGIVVMLGVILFNNTQNNTSVERAEKTSDQEMHQNDRQSAGEAYYANWKTYNNDTLNVELMYPTEKGWGLTDSSSSVSIKYECGSACGRAFVLQKLVAGSVNDRGVDMGEKLMGGNQSYTLASKLPVIYNDLEGTRWEYRPKGDTQGAMIVYYYLQKGDTVYDIRINGNGAVHEGLNITEYGERIMDTITFLK